MPKYQQPWEAQNWDELEKALKRTLNGKETPLEYVTKKLAQIERQRQGDQRRNRERRDILEYAKSNPDKFPEGLVK